MKKYQTIIVCVIMLGVLLVTTVKLSSDYTRNDYVEYDTTYAASTYAYGLSEENIALLNAIDPYLLNTALITLTYTDEFYSIMFDLRELYNIKWEEEAQANLEILNEWGVESFRSFVDVCDFAFSAIEGDYADEYDLSVNDFLNFTDAAMIFLGTESQLIDEQLAASDENFAYLYLYYSMYYAQLNSDIAADNYPSVYDYIYAYTAIEITGTFDKSEINEIAAKYSNIIVYDSIQMATTTVYETTTFPDDTVQTSEIPTATIYDTTTYQEDTVELTTFTFTAP